MFYFMVLAVDIKSGHGPSSKMCCQIQPKETKVTLYQLLFLQQNTFYSQCISNKMERFSFKSGYVIQVVKHLKEDRLVAHAHCDMMYMLYKLCIISQQDQLLQLKEPHVWIPSRDHMGCIMGSPVSSSSHQFILLQRIN